MADFTTFKKVFLSLICAFSFIAYVPVACIVGNDTKNDTDRAVAGEISTAYDTEETTDSIEDANFAA